LTNESEGKPEKKFDAALELGIDTASLCSLAGRYDNLVLTCFLVNIFLKLQL
jgi:hypothetical protein